RTGKRVAAIIGTLAALAVVIATAVELAGRGSKTIVVAPPTNATPDAGQQVEQCMSRHHLRAGRASLGNPNLSRVLTFKRCDWPAIFEGSADGYTEVSARILPLPRPNSAAYNELAAFHAPCDEIDVTFVLDNMYARV